LTRRCPPLKSAPGYDPRVMGFSDVWNRTLVYFGIAEDEEWTRTASRPRRSSSVSTAPARPAECARLPRRREPDGWTDDSTSVEAAPAAGASSSRSSSRPTRLRSADTGKASVHLVLRAASTTPADRRQVQGLRPVILNLQSADNELSKRLIDSQAGSPTRSTAACSASPTRSSS